MATAGLEEEDRILRIWTPILLRTILVASTIILIFGLVGLATQAPGAYVERYRNIQHGVAVHESLPFATLFANALHRDPRAVVTVGLMVLTLVPLARVAFCFLLFLKQRDWMFVFFTAYVLSGLVLGVVLGRIG